MPKPAQRNAFLDKLNTHNAPETDNPSDNVIVSAPVKRRRQTGMRQVGFRMPGDIYEEFIAWCHANEYAVGPTAGAALREYMARHGEGA